MVNFIKYFVNNRRKLGSFYVYKSDLATLIEATNPRSEAQQGMLIYYKRSTNNTKTRHFIEHIFKGFFGFSPKLFVLNKRIGRFGLKTLIYLFKVFKLGRYHNQQYPNNIKN